MLGDAYYGDKNYSAARRAYERASERMPESALLKANVEAAEQAYRRARGYQDAKDAPTLKIADHGEPLLPGMKTGVDAVITALETPAKVKSADGEKMAAAGEEPKVEEPVVEEPKAEEPKVEEPVAEEPKAEEPKVEEPVAEEPKAEEPKVEEPVVEEPKAEEPKVEEPVAEEPKAEEPKVEEPVVEEPKAEEPKVEEPVAEEPKAEEPKVVEMPGRRDRRGAGGRDRPDGSPRPQGGQHHPGAPPPSLQRMRAGRLRPVPRRRRGGHDQRGRPRGHHGARGGRARDGRNRNDRGAADGVRSRGARGRRSDGGARELESSRYIEIRAGESRPFFVFRGSLQPAAYSCVA